MPERAPWLTKGELQRRESRSGYVAFPLESNTYVRGLRFQAIGSTNQGELGLNLHLGSNQAVIAGTPAPPAPAPAPAPAPIAPPVAATPAQSGSVTIVAVVGGPAGGRASLTAQAPPNARCTIRYTTPLGTVSEAQGLVPATADSSGRVSWNWSIGRGTQPGIGSVSVSCTPGGTATSPIQIR